MKRFKPLILIGGCVVYAAAACVWPQVFVAAPLAALVMAMVVGVPAMAVVQFGSGGR